MRLITPTRLIHVQWLPADPNEYRRVLDYSIFKSLLVPYSKNFTTRPSSRVVKMFTFFVWDSFKYLESGNLTFLWWTRISPPATECCNCNNVYLPVSFISSRRSFLLATFWVFTQPMPQSLQIQGKSHKASKSHKKLRKALLHGTVFYMDKLFTSLAVLLLAPTGALFAIVCPYRSSKQGRQLFSDLHSAKHQCYASCNSGPCNTILYIPCNII